MQFTGVNDDDAEQQKNIQFASAVKSLNRHSANGETTEAPLWKKQQKNFSTGILQRFSFHRFSEDWVAQLFASKSMVTNSFHSSFHKDSHKNRFRKMLPLMAPENP